jgi:Cu-Zn family superoxide dismutase
MKWLRFPVAAFALAFALLALAACGKRDNQTNDQMAGTASEPTASEPAAMATPAAPAGQTAEANLQSSQSGIGGTVRFSEEPGGAGVRIVADVHGVPAGKHGFHLHETGDCSAPDYKTAGAHFNPGGAVHACSPTDPRHAGDFGNIEVGPDGSGRMEMVSNTLSFSGPNSLVGKAVILHAGEDDCKSQPSGDSGDRIACGVVQAGAGGAGM